MKVALHLRSLTTEKFQNKLAVNQVKEVLLKAHTICMQIFQIENAGAEILEHCAFL